MATKMYKIGFILILAIMLLKGANAQSSCTTTLLSLSSCINYVTGNTSTPSSTCCSSLANIVQSQPQCLCPLLNGGGSSLGISINQTLAMALPAVCNVQTPPVSQCNAVANGPAGAPAPSPLSSSTDGSNEPTDDTPTTTTGPSTPSESGSKTVPTTNGSTSGGSFVSSSIKLTAFAVSIAAWTFNSANF